MTTKSWHVDHPMFYACSLDGPVQVIRVSAKSRHTHSLLIQTSFMHLYYKYSRTPPNSSPASCICLKLPDTSTKAGQAHSVLIQVDYPHLCLYVFWQVTANIYMCLAYTANINHARLICIYQLQPFGNTLHISIPQDGYVCPN